MVQNNALTLWIYLAVMLHGNGTAKEVLSPFCMVMIMSITLYVNIIPSKQQLTKCAGDYWTKDKLRSHLGSHWANHCHFLSIPAKTAELQEALGFGAHKWEVGTCAGCNAEPCTGASAGHNVLLLAMGTRVSLGNLRSCLVNSQSLTKHPRGGSATECHSGMDSAAPWTHTDTWGWEREGGIHNIHFKQKFHDLCFRIHLFYYIPISFSVTNHL